MYYISERFCVCRHLKTTPIIVNALYEQEIELKWTHEAQNVRLLASIVENVL